MAREGNRQDFVTYLESKMKKPNVVNNNNKTNTITPVNTNTNIKVHFSELTKNGNLKFTVGRLKNNTSNQGNYLARVEPNRNRNPNTTEFTVSKINQSGGRKSRKNKLRKNKTHKNKLRKNKTRNNKNM
jgi:hypothetical protein